MLRIAIPSFAALLIAGSAYAAPAPDSADAVLKDCGAASLPPEKVDSCLERVRVLDETNPSPALQSLEVKLSQTEAKRPPSALGQNAPPPPDQSDDVQEVGPPDTPPPDQVKSLDQGNADSHVDANGRDTSDDDIDPNEGPPTDAEMHPYSRDAPAGGRN